MAEFKERFGFPDEMDYLWNCVIVFEGYRFVNNGEPFKYTVIENGILIQNEKIEFETIEKAYKAALGEKLVAGKVSCILCRFMK